ncbi:MAG: hypothetical protein ACN4GZ_03025 [Acidimicrobiales bacterium]
MTATDGPLAGPAARVVLAVLQQALLTPLGIERLLLAVKERDGRFTVLSTDASNASEPGRPEFRWSQAGPIITSLRRAQPGGRGAVVECDDRDLYRYASSVAGSNQQVLVGAILTRIPDDISLLHAAVSSAVYTLLPDSDRDIPDASVSVSVESDTDGFRSTVGLAADSGAKMVSRRASRTAMATAQATVAASDSPLELRFADQVAVGGVPISLVVADSPVGAVVGASDLAIPGTIAPALAVLKATNGVSRIQAETASDAEQSVGVFV